MLTQDDRNTRPQTYRCSAGSGRSGGCPWTVGRRPWDSSTTGHKVSRSSSSSSVMVTRSAWSSRSCRSRSRSWWRRSRRWSRSWANSGARSPEAIRLRSGPLDGFGIDGSVGDRRWSWATAAAPSRCGCSVGAAHRSRGATSLTRGCDSAGGWPRFEQMVSGLSCSSPSAPNRYRIVAEGQPGTSRRAGCLPAVPHGRADQRDGVSERRKVGSPRRGTRPGRRRPTRFPHCRPCYP